MAKTRLLSLAVVATTLLLGGCVNSMLANLSVSPSYQFDASTGDALVLIEDHPIVEPGQSWFVPVDLETGSVIGKVVKVDRYIPQKLRTDNDLFREYDAFVSETVSRFAKFTIAPGDYALVYLRQTDPSGPASVCLTEASPVYSFYETSTNYLRFAEQPKVDVEKASEIEAWANKLIEQQFILNLSAQIGDEELGDLLSPYTGIPKNVKRTEVKEVISFAPKMEDGEPARGCNFDTAFEVSSDKKIDFAPLGPPSRPTYIFIPSVG